MHSPGREERRELESSVVSDVVDVVWMRESIPCTPCLRKDTLDSPSVLHHLLLLLWLLLLLRWWREWREIEVDEVEEVVVVGGRTTVCARPE